MARRSVTGQLNMFDFFSSAESGDIGEVEMVSLMPNFEEEVVEPELVSEPEVEEELEMVAEPQIEEEPQIVEEPENFIEEELDVLHEEIVEVDTEKPVMSRIYEVNGEKIEVAYINYNKVRVTRSNTAPELHEFSNSKDAVDFYVGYMQGKEQ